MDSETYYSEKRNFFRMKLNIDAYIESDHQPDKVLAKCIDLTAKGMLLNSTIPTSVGDKITVHIPAVHNLFAPLTATAEVIRCNQIDNEHYLLGTMITDMA
ncbi:PilZ domain-containing protein [Marinicellulosiphila megalodicopiae]|uniref:PilZ domain-containing protein n=1 Tax=Marinicellulosiphila megalodicopiae TaxID=2724896 RepID=UPI003BB21B1E